MTKLLQTFDQPERRISEDVTFDRRLAMIDCALRAGNMLRLLRGRYEPLLAQIGDIGGREQPPLVQIFDDIGDDLHEPEFASRIWIPGCAAARKDAT
jgi:hypothetical protein